MTPHRKYTADQVIALYNSVIDSSRLSLDEIRDLHGIIDAYTRWSGYYSNTWRVQPLKSYEMLMGCVLNVTIYTRSHEFSDRPTVIIKDGALELPEWPEPKRFQPVFLAIRMWCEMLSLESGTENVVPLHQRTEPIPDH